MSYDAIIFDLDGTAMPSTMKGMPSQAVIDAVAKSKESIYLCAATGRPWSLAQSVIKALNLNRPCIMSGGAQIIDPISEEILWQITIDLETCRNIIELTRTFPYNVSYAQNIFTSERINPKVIDITEPTNTIYILDIPKGHEDKLIKSLKQFDGITTSKAHSWKIEDGTDLHITNSQATKEHAVGELCNILSVDPTNVAGVGDGYNDIHLFSAVGHKVAMGNAVQQLKDEADEVIGNLQEDGLAEFIVKSARVS